MDGSLLGSWLETRFGKDVLPARGGTVVGPQLWVTHTGILGGRFQGTAVMLHSEGERNKGEATSSEGK